MLLYIMLYIVLAYLMLFAALTNSVCLNNAFFFFFFICIMHSAFNLFVFPNYMFTWLLLFFKYFFMKGL